MPKVSVVTAVYNGGKYLRETLASILGQSFTDFEYILVDDGSTDDSVAIIRALDDPRVRLLVNDQNRRLVYTRNRGLAEATGSYIALTDHDDISLPDRLADQVRFLDEHPEFGLVATWDDYINLTGEKIAKRAFRRYSPAEWRVSLLYRNLFCNSTLMVRREAMPDPPYAPEFPLCEDYHFLARISRTHPIYVLPKVSVLYRYSAGRYSNFVAQQLFDLAREVKRQLLAEMGIEPTERELEIHHNLEMNHLPMNAAMLGETRAWLERLVAANERSRTYDAKAFATVTGNEWFELCRAASKLGRESWTAFRGSSLARTSQYGFAERLKLLVKCALGSARRTVAARA